MDLMQTIANDAKLGDLIRKSGHLYAYKSEAGLSNDRLAWELRAANGVQFQILNGRDMREIEPLICPDYTRGVFISENGHILDPRRLVTGIANRVVQGGGTIVRRDILRIELLADGRLTVKGEGGDMVADDVVIATGAFSKHFAAAMGDSIPLDTERGYHLYLLDTDALPTLPITDAEGKFIVTPMADGLRLAGTVEFAGLSAGPNWRRADALLSGAQRLLPHLRRNFDMSAIRQWMGFRPSLPDSMPVIGRSKRSRNVYYAFGHGHIGMTTAPKTGEIVSALISGRAPSIDISHFRPDRF
jgi:D-amino-acid dehydrogenase